MPLLPTKITDLYAFWRHDSFPYVLGGNVLKMGLEGCVQIGGYATSWFVPVMLLPHGPGAQLMLKLKKLTSERAARMREVDDDFLAALKDLAPFAMPEK